MLWYYVSAASWANLLVEKLKLPVDLLCEHVFVPFNHLLGNLGVEFLEEGHAETVVFTRGGSQ